MVSQRVTKICTAPISLGESRRKVRAHLVHKFRGIGVDFEINSKGAKGISMKLFGAHPLFGGSLSQAARLCNHANAFGSNIAYLKH